MPLLTRKRAILAKIESTYGTDPTPTGLANAILVTGEPNITPMEADFAERNLIRPYLGNSEQLLAGVRVMIDFEVELAGSGTAGTAPAWGPLMRACGHSETIVAGTSVTYAPISTGFESATIYCNVDGVLHKLTGARGTVSLSMPNKQIPKLKFAFTGIFNPVADAAAPTPTFTGFAKPLPVTNGNTTPFTLHSYSAVMSEMSFDLAGSIVHRSLVGGSEQVLITDRKPAGSITIEATTVTAKDWWTIAKNATLGGLSVTHGITAGNKVQFTSSNVQLTKPAYADLDGIQMLQMGTVFVPSSGNDEYSLILT